MDIAEEVSARLAIFLVLESAVGNPHQACFTVRYIVSV